VTKKISNIVFVLYLVFCYKSVNGMTQIAAVHPPAPAASVPPAPPPTIETTVPQIIQQQTVDFEKKNVSGDNAKDTYIKELEDVLSAKIKYHKGNQHKFGAKARKNTTIGVVKNQIGPNAVKNIKITLKKPFLDLLASSELISKKELTQRVKNVENALAIFKIKNQPELTANRIAPQAAVRPVSHMSAPPMISTPRKLKAAYPVPKPPMTVAPSLARPTTPYISGKTVPGKLTIPKGTVISGGAIPFTAAEAEDEDEDEWESEEEEGEEEESSTAAPLMAPASLRPIATGPIYTTRPSVLPAPPAPLKPITMSGIPTQTTTATVPGTPIPTATPGVLKIPLKPVATTLPKVNPYALPTPVPAPATTFKPAVVSSTPLSNTPGVLKIPLKPVATTLPKVNPYALPTPVPAPATTFKPAVVSSTPLSNTPGVLKIPPKPVATILPKVNPYASPTPAPVQGTTFKPAVVPSVPSPQPAIIPGIPTQQPVTVPGVVPAARTIPGMPIAK
jgi:hypothetical protein